MKMDEFVKAVSYLGMAYGKEYSQAETMQMYQFLKDYDYQTIINAVNSIIRTSKFVPKIAELIEECDKSKSKSKIEVIDYMWKSGYFKLSYKPEHQLSDEHAQRNYNKVMMWMERDVLPDWLLDDICYYRKLMQQEKLSGSSTNLLN